MNEYKGYTVKEVANLIGVRFQTISFYTNEGLIVPEIDNPKGKGTTRRYSKTNIFEILLIKELSLHDFSLDKIKHIIRNIRFKKYFLYQDKIADKIYNELGNENTEDIQISKLIQDYLKLEKTWGDYFSDKFNNNQILLNITNTSDGKYDVFIGKRPISEIDKPLEYQTIIGKINEWKNIYLQDGFYKEIVLIIDITKILKRVAEM